MKSIPWMVFLGACAFGGGGAAVTVVSHLESPAAGASSVAPPPAPTSDLLKIGDRFEQVARKMSPAVVYLEATKPAGSKSKAVEESGSGVLIRVEGMPEPMVLTNNHVISQAQPDQITISLADGRLFHPGRVWADPESDVAVLRLDGVGEVPTVPLGDSDSVRVGQ